MFPARPVARLCAIAAFVALTAAVTAVQASDATAKSRASACSAAGKSRLASTRAHARRVAARVLRRRLAGCFATHPSQANVVADADPPPPRCSPSLFSAPYTEMNEGTTNSMLPLRPGGRISAVMLFVDFPNLHATESTTRLSDDLVSNSRAWFAEASYGRVELDVAAVHRWYRLPRGSRDYGLEGGLRFESQRNFIADAVAAADADVDFSPFQVVYVVAAKGAPLARSPAFHAYAGDGVRADGTELRFGATFGEDVRGDARYASNVLIHETGHILGLPDLYDVPNPSFWSLFRFAGSWDTMSWNELGAHFLAWEKWKLGWLDPAQLRCLDGPGEVTTTLTPLERAGGLKAVVVPTGVSSAYVVEARRRIGQDSRLCESGVLVYSIDATVRSGYGPVRVRPAQRDASADLIDRCGPLYNAPLDSAKGEVARLTDDRAGFSVQVLSSGPEGYRVRVARTSVAPQASPLSSAPAGGNEQSFAPPEASFPFGLGWDLSLADD